MNNSKSIKSKLNRRLLKITSIIVIGAFCISTVFIDLAWAKSNSYLRPVAAKKDVNVPEKLLLDINGIRVGAEQNDKRVFPKVNNTIKNQILNRLVNRALTDSYLDFVMQKLADSISIIQVVESGLPEEAAGFAGNDPKNKIVLLFIPSVHTGIPHKEMVIRIEHEMEHIYVFLKNPKIYQTFENLYTEIRSHSMNMNAKQYFQMIISQFGDFHLKWNQVKEDRKEYALNDTENVFRNVENFLKKKCEGSKEKLSGKVAGLYVTAKFLTVIMPFETQEMESPAKKKLIDTFNKYIDKEVLEKGMEEARSLADEFLEKGYPDFQRLIEINEEISKIGKTKEIDMLPGAPAALLSYMHKEGIFSNNSKKAKEMAGKRGGNDSLGTIYKELRVLRVVGLVEGVKEGRSTSYYLSEWLRDMKIENIIRENPELKFASLNDEEVKKVAAKVKTERFKALKKAGILIKPADLEDTDVSLSFLQKIDYQIITKTNEGKSLLEIGKELNLSVNSVWRHRWMIIAKLRDKKRNYTKLLSDINQLKKEMEKGIKDLEAVSATFSSLVERPKEEVKEELRVFWKEMKGSKSGGIDYQIMTEVNNGKTFAEIKDKLELSYPAVWMHSWAIIAELEGKNWNVKKVYKNTKQVRKDMKEGIKNLEEVSATFSFLANKPAEQVARELEVFWQNMQGLKSGPRVRIDETLLKAREITVAFKNFVNSLERLKEAEKVKKECMIRIEALKDEFKTVAGRHKFPASKTLILYAEPLLANGGVIDLKESLNVLLRNNVLDKVILYAEDPVYNDILKKLIKEIAPELEIITKTKEELELKDNATEVEEIEILIGEGKDILCVIKGTVESQNRVRLRDLSRDRNIPIVVFKEADGRNVYSLAEAFKSAVTSPGRLIDLPGVETGDIEEKFYKEYKQSLQLLIQS